MCCARPDQFDHRRGASDRIAWQLPWTQRSKSAPEDQADIAHRKQAARRRRGEAGDSACGSTGLLGGGHGRCKSCSGRSPAVRRDLLGRDQFAQHPGTRRLVRWRGLYRNSVQRLLHRRLDRTTHRTRRADGGSKSTSRCRDRSSAVFTCANSCRPWRQGTKARCDDDRIALIKTTPVPRPPQNRAPSSLVRSWSVNPPMVVANTTSGRDRRFLVQRHGAQTSRRARSR